MLTTADAQKGFCHGDFMTITYLYYIEEGNDVSLYLIDFHWAGKTGEVK